MASVVALIADLMFASRIKSMLANAGDDVTLLADEARVRAHLARDSATAVLIVDLTDTAPERIALVVCHGMVIRAALSWRAGRWLEHSERVPNGALVPLDAVEAERALPGAAPRPS